MEQIKRIEKKDQEIFRRTMASKLQQWSLVKKQINGEGGEMYN